MRFGLKRSQGGNRMIAPTLEPKDQQQRLQLIQTQEAPQNESAAPHQVGLSEGACSNYTELICLDQGRRRYVVISNTEGVRRVQRFSDLRRALRAAYEAAGWAIESKISHESARIKA
jgi:hypothetical protein